MSKTILDTISKHYQAILKPIINHKNESLTQKMQKHFTGSSILVALQSVVRYCKVLYSVASWFRRDSDAIPTLSRRYDGIPRCSTLFRCYSDLNPRCLTLTLDVRSIGQKRQAIFWISFGFFGLSIGFLWFIIGFKVMFANGFQYYF